LAETRLAIRKALLGTDLSLRQPAWALLSSLAWNADLYPYLDLIDAYAEVSGFRNSVRDTADRIEVLFGPRERRVHLLAAAVRSGEGRLPRGTSLSRLTAVQWAATQGLLEFQPAVIEYLSALEPERVRYRRLHHVPALFELCGGADTLTDAPVVAFMRILEMEEGALEERFASDEGFRQAVLDLAGSSARQIRIGGRDPAPVALLRRIVDRQLAYRSRSPGLFPDGARPSSGELEWLARLQSLIGP
jgi:hypothetical protein